jgi:hypothetical protein
MSRRILVPWFGWPGRQLSGELSRTDALGGTWQFFLFFFIFS